MLLATSGAAAQAPPTGALEVPPPSFAWQGDWQSREVTFSSRATGARLYGVVFAPRALPARRLPAVVIAPGSGPGLQSFYQWAARDLAGHGYVALTVDPQGVGRSDTTGPRPGGVPFQQAGNYQDAITSGLDFLVSAGNPYAAAVDPGALGAAGHSLAARAASYEQGVDTRIRAVVAWDNLASDLSGDGGSSSGGGFAGELIGGELPGTGKRIPVTPRVPAMGQASDAPGQTTRDASPDVKKPAYSLWRSKAMPAMEVVIAGSDHLDWAQSEPGAGSPETEAFLRRSAHYTRAWFDMWLLEDATALDRLLAPEVLGRPATDGFSRSFRSAAFIPSAGVDCEDLRNCTFVRPAGRPLQAEACPRIRIRLPRRRGARVRSVRVTIDGRLAAVIPRRRVRRLIDLRGLPRRTVRVKLRVRTTRGTLTLRRTYRSCLRARRR